MIVRKIRPEELKRARELDALAFEYSLDNCKTPDAFFHSVTQAPKDRVDLYWRAQWAAFEDDDRTMLSTFIAHPFTVCFDGHAAPMAGIGGVATLPQHRRRGGVRACFEKALPDLAADGVVFSYLYPFSTAYYRKFGYEPCCERMEWRLKLSALPRFDAKGSCELLEPGRDLTGAVQAVDQTWQRRYNMAVLCEEIDYRWVRDANPFKSKEYAYLYRSESGVPMGYISFIWDEKSPERDLRCSRLVFSCPEGFRGLMNLLCTLAADHAHVYFALPGDMDLYDLLPEWSMGAVNRTAQAFGMARILNVERALGMARMRGDGELTVEIVDGQIQQNNGCFRAVFRDGVVQAVEKGAFAPDMRMDIRAFTRMLIGCRDLDGFFPPEGVEMRCPPEKAAQVFYRKPTYIWMGF